jgi:DNA-binding MarR family transcriptional regulator
MIIEILTGIGERVMSFPAGDPSNQGQRLGSQFSLAVVMYHQAVADKAGLHVTDYKCLGTIQLHENMTPGKLARLTGLSTAAITTVIDRLERAGYVRRIADPADRRRTLIKADRDKINAELVPIMRDFFASMGSLFSQYEPRDVQLITDFLVRMTDVFAEETRKLRGDSGRAADGD